MSFLENIQDNTIVICETDCKKYLLKKMSLEHIFLNVKFFTKKDFISECTFKYKDNALEYILDKYNYKIDIAKMYLNNIYYIDEEKKYKSPKLNFLVNLKKELISVNLLEYNKEFTNNIKDYNIILVGYPYLEEYEEKIFNKLNVKIINDITKYELKKVYEFVTQEEEINYVCKSICKLVNNGVNINDIKICNVNEDYYNDLQRIFNFYNIPISIPSNNTLYSNKITKTFLDNYNMGENYAIDTIENKNSDIVNKIISICNKYIKVNNKNTKIKLIIEDLKNTKIDNYNYKNFIEIIDIDAPIDNEYVFLMNFNNGSIPVSLKDEFYITDNIKNEVNLKTTIEINKLNKDYIKNRLKTIKNLTITYKLINNKGEFYPSPLLDELNLNIINEKNDILESYSYKYDLIEFAKKQDLYEKYGIIDSSYFIYKNSLKNIPYKKYNNEFTGINKYNLREYLNNKLTLSYSSISNYYKCSFRYFLANILKLDKYEDKFEAFIGSMFHDVLEKCFANNLSVFEEIDNYIKCSGKKLNIKERFYVDKIKKDILFVINVLNKQKEYINLDKTMYEKNIVIDKSKDITVNFVGFIDKILYKENNNNTLVSIIDYKTGNVNIDLNYVPDGLNLQLPIYLYLVKKSNLFVNPKFVGFYIEYILDNDILRDNSSTYEEKLRNNLKLVGYSNKDIHSLVEFDSTYEDSLLIKGMKVKANGEFSHYSKVLSDDEINKVIDITEQNIDKTIDNILEGNFKINPKKIGYDKVVGCEFCKFKDICFKTEKDYIILKKQDNLDYLRGEKNA